MTDLLAAAKAALDYIDEVGPCHLDAGLPESGCDLIFDPLRAAVEAEEARLREESAS